MSIKEDQIWDVFNSNKPISIDARWLEQVYSLDLSIELRFTIGERLGLLANKGWNEIKILIDKHGSQPEFIHAAGLCHQIEACDFLLKLLKKRNSPDLTIVNALACWGAIIQTAELKKILKEDSMQMRLAGLNLLSFKSHSLNASELLELVEDLLDDSREGVVIQLIKILQRRDEADVINCIGKIARNGKGKTVSAAIIALGAIGTRESVFLLSVLSQELTAETHRQTAQKQISHQYIYPL